MSAINLIKLVSGFAPTLGTALGGPIGGVVGALIASLFGANKDDPQDIISRIQADPDAELKLKNLELQHQTELASIGEQKKALQVDDVKNARDREIQLAKIGVKDKMPHVIAVLIIGAVIGIVFAQLVPGVNTANSALLGQISGMLTRELIEIIRYYFGSSIDDEGIK